MPVQRRVVRLEVEAELLVVDERLVLPRHPLLRVEQAPAVVARGEAAGVRAQVARRVALLEDLLARGRQAAAKRTCREGVHHCEEGAHHYELGICVCM